MPCRSGVGKHVLIDEVINNLGNGHDGGSKAAPGARARVALTGLTVAEYFRDAEGQDVLLFVDNIFRNHVSNARL